MDVLSQENYETLCNKRRQGSLTVPLEESPHKRVNADKLQLDVVTIEGDPLPIRELLDDNAVLLQCRGPTRRLAKAGKEHTSAMQEAQLTYKYTHLTTRSVTV